MPLTLDAIKQSKTPYDLLQSGDVLAENKTLLENLNLHDKRTLAANIIKGCPYEDLRKYARQINALNTAVPNQGSEKSFHQILKESREVKQRICDWTVVNIMNPYTMLMSPQFNADLFNEYNQLARDIIQGKEEAIVARLANETPKEHISTIIKNINNCFPGSLLYRCVMTAFENRANLEKATPSTQALTTNLSDNPNRLFFQGANAGGAATITDNTATKLQNPN